jgi:hypothetical protein
MSEQIDLFVLNSGTPQWIGSVQSLADAMKLFMQKGPGQYVAFSSRNRQKMFYSVEAMGKVSQMQA